MAAVFPRTLTAMRGGNTGAYYDPLTMDFPMRDQTLVSAPTFPPFKFENKRTRIDWRMLHSVDVHSLVGGGAGPPLAGRQQHLGLRPLLCCVGVRGPCRAVRAANMHHKASGAWQRGGPAALVTCADCQRGGHCALSHRAVCHSQGMSAWRWWVQLGTAAGLEFTVRVCTLVCVWRVQGGRRQ